MSDNITGILRAMADREREPLTFRQCENLHFAAETIDLLRARVAELEADNARLWAWHDTVMEDAEPVAWVNPRNGAVIDARKKTQRGIGNGYPNFSVPVYPNPQPLTKGK